MTLMQMRQKQADERKAARAIQTKAENENRLTTAEEEKDIQAHLDAAAALEPKITQAVALLEAERVAPAVAISSTGVLRTSGGHDNAADKPWANFGEQLAAIRDFAVGRGRGDAMDPRLQAALGSGETADTDGGFLVAPEFATEILAHTWEEGQISGRAQRMPMRSSRLVLNGLNEDSRLPGFRYGGISVYRLAEAAAYTSSKPNFKQIELIAQKLIGLLYSTEELLEDTEALSAWASKTFPKAFAFQLDDECLNGTGAGQFLGVLNSGALVTQAKDSAQTAATVTTSNILNMWSRLLASSRKNAAWFVNQNVEPQLYALTIPGNMGTAVALYVQPGDRGNNGQYGTILGRPVIPVEQCATLGTVGDIVLADMDQYLIGERSGIRADSSIHVAFLTGEQAFRWMLRNDGKTIQKAPVTPYKGSETLSSFVALATRS